MTSLLRSILEQKKIDMKKEKELMPLRQLKKRLIKKNTVSTFYKHIAGVKKVALIAEVKLASPTVVFPESDDRIFQRVRAYEHAGAHAVSYITESHIFKGTRSFIPKMKRRTNLPVLQKDFVIDTYQIYQAKYIGSDALLFIARIVSGAVLKQFIQLAYKVGVEPVVEVFDENDLKKALATATRIIAVNARDLETLTVSVDSACALLKKIPKTYMTLGFSGISSSEDVKKYRDARARGVLVGTALMKTKNISAFIAGLETV